MQKATLSVERANCASAGGLEGASRKEWDALLYASLSPLTWELHFEKLMKLNLGLKKENSALRWRLAKRTQLRVKTSTRQINSFISVEKKRARFRFVRLMSRADPAEQVCIQTGMRWIMQLGCLEKPLLEEKNLGKEKLLSLSKIQYIDRWSFN